ncbi:hypothetical protein K491DRAFT_755998 [Lophiostoma macrostomum CBS 122681]|uniref:Ricin B lectin domain-containing protein n=1 Tax=Lophiostoma macrostomum CBS 122681 TaxID=1314788 RepID=A0A6A6TH89_9PLEO|nr:hypothetical protein K491DRAFT_755998 [Lophiostoma macrostomum CBS 122681]
MADLPTEFHLSNAILNSTRVIASTRDNNIIVIEDFNSTDNQRWYVSDTGDSNYFRLHTIQKGDNYALDVLNYDGYNSIDLEFLDVVDRRTGQLWMFDTWADGTLKISNNFTGPDMHLEYLDSDSAPKLAGGNSDGQHWSTGNFTSDAISTTLSSTTMVSTTSTPGPTSISKGSATSAIGSATATSTSTATATATESPAPHHTSSGAIAGSVIGAVVAAVLLVFIIRYVWNKVRTPSQVASTPGYRPNRQQTTEWNL